MATAGANPAWRELAFGVFPGRLLSSYKLAKPVRFAQLLAQFHEGVALPGGTISWIAGRLE